MKRIYIFMLCGILTGCIILPISNDEKISLTFKGEIFDKDSSKPVASAKITLSLPEDYSDKKIEPISTFSGQDGGYKIGPIIEKSKKYVIWFLPAEGFCFGNLSVNAPGYKEFKHEFQEFGSAAVNGSCSGLPKTVNIELEREKI